MAVTDIRIQPEKLTKVDLDNEFEDALESDELPASSSDSLDDEQKKWLAD